MPAVLAFKPLPQNPDTFADLLERIAGQRDRAAFMRLFGWYAPRVKGLFLSRGAADQRAEDLALDVMAAVWRAAARFDRRTSSVDAWIFRIARNLALEAARPERAASAHAMGRARRARPARPRRHRGAAPG